MSMYTTATNMLAWSPWLWQVMSRASWEEIGSVTSDSIGKSYILFQSQQSSPTSYARTMPCSKTKLGKIQQYEATLEVCPNALPRIFNARPVPLAIKPSIEEELDKLEASGVAKKVESSEWAAPIIPVPKNNGQFRICGDFKVTINQALYVNQYSLPKSEDLFASLAEGKKFPKLDSSQAYQQLPLDEESTKFVTINTHRGLYRYNRLPFGAVSAPALFQKLMHTVLQDIPHVICYIDDILVTGTSHGDHLCNLGTHVPFSSA